MVRDLKIKILLAVLIIIAVVVAIILVIEIFNSSSIYTICIFIASAFIACAFIADADSAADDKDQSAPQHDIAPERIPLIQEIPAQKQPADNEQHESFLHPDLSVVRFLLSHLYQDYAPRFISASGRASW